MKAELVRVRENLYENSRRVTSQIQLKKPAYQRESNQSNVTSHSDNLADASKTNKRELSKNRIARHNKNRSESHANFSSMPFEAFKKAFLIFF